MRTPMFEFIRASQVVFYHQLQDNKWPKGFNELLKKEKVKSLKLEEKKGVEALPMDKEELLKVAKRSHDKFFKLNEDSLANFMNMYRGNEDP